MNKKGFTLIELLVAMTIVSVLLGLALVSYQGARKTARDGKRKADLEEIRSALEMYKTDNGEYPTEAWCDSSVGSCGSACPCSGSDWGGGIASSLEPDYIHNLPKDPINNSTYYYFYEPYNPCCNSGYELGARLETSSQWYKVYNP